VLETLESVKPTIITANETIEIKETTKIGVILDPTTSLVNETVI